MVESTNVTCEELLASNLATSVPLTKLTRINTFFTGHVTTELNDIWKFMTPFTPNKYELVNVPVGETVLFSCLGEETPTITVMHERSEDI